MHMEEKETQCQFYIQTNEGLERCQEPLSDYYKFEDGSSIGLCDKHLMMIWDAMGPEIFPPDINH